MPAHCDNAAALSSPFYRPVYLIVSFLAGAYPHKVISSHGREFSRQMIVHKILDFFTLQILLTCQMFFAVNAFKVFKKHFCVFARLL